MRDRITSIERLMWTVAAAILIVIAFNRYVAAQQQNAMNTQAQAQPQCIEMDRTQSNNPIYQQPGHLPPGYTHVEVVWYYCK